MSIGLGLALGVNRASIVPAIPNWVPRGADGAPAVMWRDHLDGRFYAGGAVQPNLAAFNAAASRTFSRSTTKTRRNASGALESVAINAEALDWAADGSPLGLSLEGARQNLVTQSEFTNGLTGLSAANATPVTDIEGGRTGIYLDNSTGAAYVYKTMPAHIGSVTFSFFVEMADGNQPVLGAGGSTSTSNTFAILANGSSAWSGYVVERVGVKLWRVSATKAVDGAGGSVGVAQYQSNQQRRIKVTGFQVEAAAFASSYIPTGATALTRAADIDLHTTGTLPFAGYDQTQGCLVWEGDVSALDASITHELVFFGADPADSMRLLAYADGRVEARITTGGAPQTNIGIPAGTIAAGTRFRAVLAWQTNQVELWVNGVKAATDVTSIIPTVPVMYAMCRPGGANLGFGHLARLGYLAAPPWDRLATLSQIGGV